MFHLILTLILIGICAYAWIKQTSKPANFPPGPPRYPLIGSILSMTKNPWDSKPSVFWGVLQMQKKYGNVFGMYLGSMRTVVLTNYEDIKKIMNMDEASSRPPFHPAEIRPGWEHVVESDPILNKDRFPGVIFSNVSLQLFGIHSVLMHISKQGKYWKEQRRYVLKQLRDLGFGKTSMEDSLHQEVSKLVEFLKPMTNKKSNLDQTLNISILNALWAILVGEKLNLNDPKLHKTMKAFDDVMRTSEGPTCALANVIPFPKLLLMPGLKQVLKMDDLQSVFEMIIDLIKPTLERHQASLDEENIRDFVDVYLLEVMKTVDPKSSFFK